MFNQYLFIFLISLLISGIFFYKWQKRFNVYSVVFYTIIPIAEMGFWMRSIAKTVDAAIIGNQILYVGGCYMSFFMMLCLFSICGIKVKKWISLPLFGLTTLTYLSVLTVGYSDIFYKDVYIEIRDGITFLEKKQYGFMHTALIVVAVSYFVVSFITLIYVFFKNKKFPRLMVVLQFVTFLTGICGYFIGQIADTEIVHILSYVILQAILLVIINRMCLYDVSDNVMEGVINDERYGYISVDRKMRYLGSNITAEKLLPALTTLRLDRKIAETEYGGLISGWIEQYKSENKEKILYKSGSRIFVVTVSDLLNNGVNCGYQIVLTDETRDIKYISLLNHYNANLKEEVEKKTAHIDEMHNNLILGMAVLVESRDNSTGGHIRRTSDCIKILINKIKETGAYEISDDFRRNLVRAAPMHDLGKIAVDDRILRKPGRFEPEEYEIMKTHAAKGAEMINKILDNDDDEEDFRIMATNVAHYHHERVDGTGYPEGLKGNDIPLEARIMAVVDVYDALVSERCYKKSMPFDKAFEIIDEGMGTQFDPNLRESFHAARAELEAYYS